MLCLLVLDHSRNPAIRVPGIGKFAIPFSAVWIAQQCFVVDVFLCFTLKKNLAINKALKMITLPSLKRLEGWTLHIKYWRCLVFTYCFHGQQGGAGISTETRSLCGFRWQLNRDVCFSKTPLVFFFLKKKSHLFQTQEIKSSKSQGLCTAFFDSDQPTSFFFKVIEGEELSMEF